MDLYIYKTKKNLGDSMNRFNIIIKTKGKGK